MMVQYCKLSQVVIPIEAAVPNVVSLFEQPNISWYPELLISQMPSPYLSIRLPRNNLLSAGKVGSTLSLSNLRVILILQPYVTTYFAGTLIVCPTMYHIGYYTDDIVLIWTKCGRGWEINLTKIQDPTTSVNFQESSVVVHAGIALLR